MMSNTDAKSKSALGFLTVVEHPQYGLFGGYLVLNIAGRPLEFHCTAPIKPNRAQEILYGPTLASLSLRRADWTNAHPASRHCPFACVHRSGAGLGRPGICIHARWSWSFQPTAKPRRGKPLSPRTADDRSRVVRLDAAHHGPRLVTFELGRNRLALPERAEEDRGLVTARLAELADSFDLAEPFQRIRAAIEEAQQAVR